MGWVRWLQPYVSQLQPCSPAALQPCSPAALQPCSPAALQPCSPMSQVSAGLPSPDSLKAALGLGAGRATSKMDVALGGGNFMGQGCYAVSVARWLGLGLGLGLG
jgi:hypothetical protein